jgi:hypothetical protein
MISRCAGQGCWVRVVGFRVIRVVGFRVVRVVGFRVVGLGLLGQACGVRVRGDLAWFQRGRCVQNLGFSLEFRVGRVLAGLRAYSTSNIATVVHWPVALRMTAQPSWHMTAQPSNPKPKAHDGTAVLWV